MYLQTFELNMYKKHAQSQLLLDLLQTKIILIFLTFFNKYFKSLEKDESHALKLFNVPDFD